jgi:hypothetical protein
MKLKDIEGLLPKKMKKPWYPFEVTRNEWIGYIGEKEIELDVEEIKTLLSKFEHCDFPYMWESVRVNLAIAIAKACPIKVKV